MLQKVVNFLRFFVLFIQSVLQTLFGKTEKYVLKNRTAVVTGAGNGLGRALALELAERGNTVVVLDINQRDANDVADEIRRRGQKCHVQVCDVSRKEDVASTAQKIKDAVGDVDLLINNAGVVATRTLLDLSDAEIERTININLLSVFWMMRAFLPEMIKRRAGHIVNISSILGLTPGPRVSAYCASKSGIAGLHESVRMELEMAGLGKDIGMTCVYPAFIQTRLLPSSDIAAKSPILKPLTAEAVATEIVTAIENRRETLNLPAAVTVFNALRAILPTRLWVQIYTQGVIGKGMKSLPQHSTLGYLDGDKK